MNKTISKSLLLLGVTTMLWGCYPDGPEYYSDYDIVYTNYDENFTFPGHKYYAMPDKIVKIEGNIDQGNPPEFVGDTYASIIFDRIRSNMSALGYSLVSDTTQADLILFPSALETTNIGYYYDYWGYYYGWYYPPYYGGWYYPYPVTYSYSTGSLLLNIIDRRSISPNDKSPIVWTAIINGLLEGSTADFTSRMNKTVDQAFEQSPYLQQ